jgi:FemAB-related protein (PEP-CTERM system-associated)
MTLTVARFSGEGASWDEFVRAQPQWSHFHLFGWQRVLGQVFGHETPYLAASDGSGALAGVLPLVRVRSALFGHYLVSMPFFNYGGPLGSDEAIRGLAAYAVAMAGEEGVKLLELRSRHTLPLGLPVSHRKITVVLDLVPGHAEGSWKKLPSALRSQVRRPQKEGVTVRFGRDQVGPFFAVFARHMRDLGTPTHGRRLFDTIADAFGDDAWFGCAYLGDIPVACGAGFHWGDEFEMTWASALREHKRIAPNMLLYWSFIERAAQAGLSKFNFGRCTPGSGTHKFKSQWGAVDEQLHWYQHAREGSASTPSPDDPKYRWGPRLWQKLPVPIATALGPRLVRFIP